PRGALAALGRSLDGRCSPRLTTIPATWAAGRVGGGSCRGCGRLPAGSRSARLRSGSGSGTGRLRPTPRRPRRGPGGAAGRPCWWRSGPWSWPWPPGRWPRRGSGRGELSLGGCQKPLGAAGAVQSEHYALPIRVRYPGYRRWVLLGQADPGACPGADCPAPTRIRSLESSYAGEAYELTFATPARAGGLRLRAARDRGGGPGRSQGGGTALAFDD